ncbi:hypothetical protein STEG23_015548 [Scotinomys teguina]
MAVPTLTPYLTVDLPNYTQIHDNSRTDKKPSFITIVSLLVVEIQLQHVGGWAFGNGSNSPQFTSHLPGPTYSGLYLILSTEKKSEEASKSLPS